MMTLTRPRLLVIACCVCSAFAFPTSATAGQSAAPVPSGQSRETPAQLRSTTQGLVALARASETPEAVTRRYFQALQQRGLVASVEYLHPEEMRAFKDMMMPIVQMEAQMKESEFRTALFGAGATVAMVESSDPEVFVRRFMSMDAVKQAFGGINFARLEVLGTVPEGAAIMHVLVRSHMRTQGMDVSSTSVVSLRSHDGSWKMMLNDRIRGMASAFRAALAKVPQDK
jgi:hypothetical protein